MAKLIRDRSTKEKDRWWSEVARAAESAPTLTYERRSAPMANSDDVLGRAVRVIEFRRSNICITPGPCDCPTCETIRALAAEVRERRRDREYLERLQGGPYFVVRLDSADALNRENVERFRGMGIIRLLDADAAMGGGED